MTPKKILQVLAAGIMFSTSAVACWSADSASVQAAHRGAEVSIREEEEVRPTAMNGDLAIKLIMPKQQQGAVPYFNLILKPGQKVALPIKVTNTSNHSITVDLTPYNASTNEKLDVDYESTEANWGNQPKLTDLISSKLSGLILKKHETKVVTFTLSGAKINSLVLGAIKTKEEGKKNGIITAIMVRNSNSNQNEFNMELNNLTMTKNGKPMFITQIMNKGGLISKATITEKIMHNGKEISSTKKENVNLAPNAEFTLASIYKQQTQLDAGDYNILLNVHYNNKTYNYKKNVNLSQNMVDAINKKMKLQAPRKKLNFGHVAIVSIAVLFVLGIGGYIGYDKYKEAQIEKEDDWL